LVFAGQPDHCFLHPMVPERCPRSVQSARQNAASNGVLGAVPSVWR
jgi:hypothetical protein